jgi:hypothetical protein
MANFLVVNNETGFVENCVSLEEGSTWQAPQGFTAYPAIPNAGIGWAYANGEWVEPLQPETESETNPAAES